MPDVNGLRRGIARLVVRAASLLAPVAGRRRMRDEWDAELAREFREGGGWSAVVASWGAVADARTLRALNPGTEGWTMGGWMTGWRSDLVLALRSLLRSPVFAVTAVVTLAVGLGSSAAMFTLIDRMVLDPLPYPTPDRLVRLENRVPGVGPDERWDLSTAQWVHLTDRSRTIERVAIYRESGANVMTVAGSARAFTIQTTSSGMDLLGARAAIGRVLSASDDAPGAHFTVVLSHAFWTSTLAGDPQVVGGTLSMNGTPAEIIGVLEPGLTLPGVPARFTPDIWSALRIDRAGSFGNNHVFPAIARLAPGSTPADAIEEMERLARELPSTFPDAYSAAFFERYGFRTVAVPLKEHVLGDMARNLWLLVGGIALVLVIAMANTASLFVVRSETRRQSYAVRAALGAGRAALARAMFVEGLVIGLGAGALALLVARWSIPVLTAMAPAHLPRIDGVALDASGILFTLGLSAAVGLLLALFPVLSQQGVEGLPGRGLSTRGSTPSRAGRRFRSAMVVAQLSLALTLLVGAGLLVEGVRALHTAGIGVVPEGVLAVDLHLAFDHYPDDVAIWGLQRALLDDVRRLPGVLGAGLGEEIPVSGRFGCTTQGFEDPRVYERIREAGMTTCAGQVRVTPGYFEALGIQLLAGRTMTHADLDDPLRASAVVSRAFAERFWPGEDPIGKGVGAMRTDPPFFRVVGVVGDVPRATDSGNPFSETALAVYYPVVDNPGVVGNWYWWPGSMTLLVRTDLDDPMSLVPPIRTALTQLDPEVPLANARLLEDVVAEAAADVMFVSLLLGIAAAISVLLAAVGLYGVVAYVVSQRTREIGMRMAIGARPREVERMIVAGTLGLAVSGVALGAPLAFFATAVLQRVMDGVVAPEPWVYVLSAGSLVVIALLAGWLPARRAASVDPVRALRAD